LPVLLPAVVGVAFLGLPVLALLMQVPWGDLFGLLAAPESLLALRLSLITSLAATGVCVVLGVPLAVLLARTPGVALVRAAVLLPLVLPPVVGGVALLSAFGRRGVLGGPLYDLTGFSLPFTTWSVILAEAFVALPFLVITVEAAMRNLDSRYDDASATLGASEWFTLRRVTLPMIAPALVAGAVLAWARALGEFGATITFAGNFPGVTQTLPLAVYSALETNRAAALALSFVLIAVCIGVLIALRDRFFRRIA
jgi:molybdate transport system permease protein